MIKFSLARQLYFQVLVCIVLGALLGYFFPHAAVKMKPLGDGFITLIRMMIAPIIFVTVVTGITNLKDIKEIGRIGLKAIIYFELMSTLALLIGIVVTHLVQPGAGMNVDIHSLDKSSIATYVKDEQAFSAVNFILHIIPNSLVGAFAEGDILAVLLVSILFGFGIVHVGEKVKLVTSFIEQLSLIFFAIVGFIMKLAPIGAFGAMAFTIGAYGIESLLALGRLLANVYIICFLFVFVVLNLVAKLCKFSLWDFLQYIKEEIFIVLGTSSSEAALPRMVTKLERYGCGKSVVGLVLPAGYSFNLDGTSIYLTSAALFVAQALNIPLSWEQQLVLFAVLLLTSKGAAAVTGGGFIVLAATLSSLHTIPVEGIVLLLGIDRFMSEARAVTNLIGNGVATVVIAKWEGDFNANASHSE